MTEEPLTTEEHVDTESMSDEEELMAKLKEDITVEVEDLGTLRRKLTITVPADTVSGKRSDQFGELKRDSVVPGFRKGRAPMTLIEKRFGSDVNEQLSSQLMSSSYMAAVEKEDLKVIGDPLVWAAEKAGEPEKLVSVEQAFDMVDLPSEGDFTYSCEVELRPEFELPELEGIKLIKPAITTSDDDVQSAIDRMRAMRGQYEPATGKIAEDDMIVCKIKATVGDKVVLEEDNCQLAARPMRYAGILMDELGKSLIGAKNGDTVKLTGELPDDFEDDSVRGQSANVELELLEHKSLVLPELDAAFLETLGIESEDELRELVRNDLEATQHEQVRRNQREQVNDYLIEKADFELPADLSRRQGERVVARRLVELANMGMPEAEISKKVDAIRTGAVEDASRDLKMYFVFEKIAEEWDIETTEDEINGAIASIARRQNRRFDRVRDEMMRTGNMNSLYLHVRDEKIIDRLIEKAEIVEGEAAGGATKKKTATRKKATKKKASKKADK